MASRSVLRSVAHDLAHSFVSRNNDVDGYWALGLILAEALDRSEPKPRIDLITGASSAAFGGLPLAWVPGWYVSMCSSLIERQGLARSRVQGAVLSVGFELEPDRLRRSASPQIPPRSQRFTCTAQIVDDRGRCWAASCAGACFPHDERFVLRRRVGERRRAPPGPAPA